MRSRRSLVAVCVIGASLLASAATLRAQSASFTGAPLRDPFFSYARPAQFSSAIQTSIEVPVSSGSYLSCTLVQPGANGGIAPGRFSGIVEDYTAYHAVNAAAISGYTYYAERGYNVIQCDPPGAGNSPGSLDPFGPAEQQANYDLIEWMAKQPWSDGNIGQTGASYGAHTSLLVAVHQPPHLRAIVPLSGISDWYLNTIYHGGIESATIWSWEIETVGLGAGGTNATMPASQLVNTTVAYHQHPVYDDYWRARSVSSRYDKLAVPTLELDGWNDRYKDGMIANFMARSNPLWLVLGPWTHASTTGATPQGSINAESYALAWFDHFLKGMSTAPLPREKVTSLEMPEATGTGWHQFPAWPPPGASPVRLYFNSDNSLGLSPGAAGEQTYLDNGKDSGCDPSSAATCDPNQAAYDSSPFRLAYTSAPLEKDLVIAGPTQAVVKAAFPSSDGHLVVRLDELAPDGTETQLATGWRRADMLQGFDHLISLTPGQLYDIPVHVYPQHYRIPKGDQIRLSISSGDFTDALPDNNQGQRITVATGANGSYADMTMLGPSPGVSPAAIQGGNGCTALKRLTFRINPVPHGRVVRVVVYVNGRRALLRRGHDLKRISLPRPRGNRLHIKIVTTNNKGGKVVTTRDLTGCVHTKVIGKTHRHKAAAHRRVRHG